MRIQMLHSLRQHRLVGHTDQRRPVERLVEPAVRVFSIQARYSTRETYSGSWGRWVFEPFVVRVVDLISPVHSISRLSVCVCRHVSVVLGVTVGASYKST